MDLQTKSTLKRKRLAIEDKVHIIGLSKKGSSVKALATQYGIGEQTVRDILKSEDKIFNFVSTSNSSKAFKKKKSMKTSTWEDLDRALLQWFNQERSVGTPINGVILGEKAKFFHDQLGLEGEFNASGGWLWRFKNRYGIREISIQGEKLSADNDAADEFQREFKEFITAKNFTEEQIYNADETGLYWKCLPTRTLASEHEKQAPGAKPSKERITLMLCANAAGTHRLKLAVIGKAKKPRSFKGTRGTNLPVKYYNQQSAWMDEKIFRSWFHDEFVPQVRKHLKAKNLPQEAVLLIDNAPSHPVVHFLKSDDGLIFAKYLPPNTTSLIQPMDQGVIAALKKKYRGNLLRKYVEEGKTLTGFWKEHSILDAIYDVAASWTNVAESTLQNCWTKIIVRETEHPNELPEEIETSGDSAESLSGLAQSLEGGENVDTNDILEWFDCDREASVFSCLTPEEIVRDVQENHVQEVEEPEEDVGTKITLNSASNSISELIEFFHDKDIPTSDKVVLYKLRGLIKKWEFDGKKQTTIENYFTKN